MPSVVNLRKDCVLYIIRVISMNIVLHLRPKNTTLMKLWWKIGYVLMFRFLTHCRCT